jgi:Glycosyl hydrolase family 61.
MRHNIIALHSAGTKDGAQNYPRCLNLKVTGDGTNVPEGTLGEELYTDTDAGILVNIYSTIPKYVMPGPALFSS